MSTGGESPAAPAAAPVENRQLLFWACFVALITTAFGFIVRALVIDEWGAAYDLDNVRTGEIFSAGLWPFAISIILFSLVIDRIGYGTAMVFAFACHVLSAVVTIFGPDYMYQSFGGGEAGADAAYWALYLGNVIVALGNGTVEAVINPVVATIFARQKTKWLNMLHAGWPGGLVLGGVIILSMDALAGAVVDGETVPVDWRYKVALIFLPTLAYGAMMLFCRFPVSERVAAGVSYRDMLRELGWGGALICSLLMFSELGRVVRVIYEQVNGPVADGTVTDGVLDWWRWVAAALTTAAFAAYVRGSFGRPLLVFLLLVMIPLASTELGTDSWISTIMGPVMTTVFGIPGGWVLVYTSFIMMVLRFFAGPIVHAVSPLGLLAGCSAIAAVGLVMLAQVDAAVMVLIAATVYAVGKTFFWPTMLGVVAEQSPRGGALTLNATGGVGMLAAGTVGAVFLGYFAETNSVDRLEAAEPGLAARVTTEKKWAFGEYPSIDAVAAERAGATAAVAAAEVDGKQDALAYVAFFPLLMLVCYLGLIFYFKTQGGYQAVELTEGPTSDHEDEYAGGVEGPVM